MENELRGITFDKRKNMKPRGTQVVLAIAAVVIFTLAAPIAFAQKDMRDKPAASVAR